MSKFKRKDDEFIKKVADEVNRQIEEKLPKRWLRTKDVRLMLNVSDGTLQRMRVDGDIPYARITSGTILYPYSGVVQALEEQTNWGKRGEPCR